VSDTVMISLRETTAQRPHTFDVAPNTAVRAGTQPPIFVPRNQLYYWTRDWQEGELLAHRELDAGEFRTFPDGSSAVRWLLDENDEQDD